MALRALWRGVVFAALTLVTQIGGLAYAAAHLAPWARRTRLGFWAVFLALYAGVSLGATALAPMFGRERLPCFTAEDAPMRSASILYCALNRNFVTPPLLAATKELARSVAETRPGAVLLTLDGSFPFIDGFPLLPHISHDDGEKLDLALYYEDAQSGAPANAAPSPIGYFAYEQPRPGDPLPCDGLDLWPSARVDLDWLQPRFRGDLALDMRANRAALRWLTGPGRAAGVGKILLEPHLETRFGVASDMIRFQGCRIVRHDDHYHVQLR